ncbi:hypothetical protein V1478_004797 [Vespula squamosa]|uniref:Uncharacterized protein n=1 Tax=Vespula squamosa TaxID=30214 RepID=A0ABD2BES9_VESSQ
MIMTAEAGVTATTAAQQQQQQQQQQVHEPMPPSHLVAVVARLGRVLRALRLISRANLGACIQWVSAVNAGKHPPAMAVLVWLPLREPARQGSNGGSKFNRYSGYLIEKDLTFKNICGTIRVRW